MHILIAPDKYKGCLTAKQVAQALAEGLTIGCPGVQTECLPMADGGDGTVQSLVDALGGRIVRKKVTDPLGRPVTASYGILADKQTAVIEMSSASGWSLVCKPELNVDDRDPLITTTFGTGELIKAAVKRGCSNFIVGIGGSATNDGGAGMAQALGANLLDTDGKEIGRGGGALSKLASIDLSSMITARSPVQVTVACDVTNPLCGKRGASMVYGPQKCPGSWNEQKKSQVLSTLDDNLAHFAKIIKRDLRKNVLPEKGAGAAGGLGAGLMAFLGAALKRGGDIVADAVGLDKHLANADLVVTGEGATDASTRFNKVPVVVADRAKQFQVPVICVSGTVNSKGYGIHKHGIDVVLGIPDRPMTLETAVKEARQLLRRAGEEIGRMLRVGQS